MIIVIDNWFLDFQSSKQILKDSKRKTTFKDISDEVEVELKEEDLLSLKLQKSCSMKRDLQVFQLELKLWNNIASYDNDDIVDVIDSTTTGLYRSCN